MSKRKPISQTEARRMRAELAALKERERQRNSRWTVEYPGGVHLGSHNYADGSSMIPTAIRTARALGCHVVAVDDGGTIRFYAVKP